MTTRKITGLIKTTLLAGVVLLTLASCNNDSNGSEKSVEKIQTEGKISSIIRSPISADGTVDTVNVAKMVFEETDFNFGEVDAGKVVEHVFKFTNTGTVPLIIHNVKSTCSCTIPQYPKEAIPPGAINEINVRFDTKGKEGVQEKPVVVTANTYPSNTTVYVRGTVTPK